MIILFGGEKGGTGKSTLATNLCVWLSQKNSDFVLLDADRQNTSGNWASERAKANPTLPQINCVQRYGNIATTVQDLSKRYEHVLIDAAGRDSEELRSSLVVADVLFSPLKASQSDLWTVNHLYELIKLSRVMNQKLRAFAVLSMASPNPRVSEAEQAKEMLKDYPELMLANTVVRDRKVYRDAMCEAKGVIEMSDERAKQEIKTLAKEVF
jgi:chromosome partitioning protein